jgi:hypothetical protein
MLQNATQGFIFYCVAFSRGTLPWIKLVGNMSQHGLNNESEKNDVWVILYDVPTTVYKMFKPSSFLSLRKCFSLRIQSVLIP